LHGASPLHRIKLMIARHARRVLHT